MGTIDYRSALIQIMVQFTDAYMIHSGLMYFLLLAWIYLRKHKNVFAFFSYLNTEKTRVVETFPRGRQGYIIVCSQCHSCRCPGDSRSQGISRYCISLIYPGRSGFSNTLQWRHNECDGVSNHQRFDCLLSLFFRRKSKKKHKSSSLLASVRRIHRKMFPFDDVNMFVGLSFLVFILLS